MVECHGEQNDLIILLFHTNSLDIFFKVELSDTDQDKSNGDVSEEVR